MVSQRFIAGRCFGARRVVLFGSLAHAAWFTPGFDVDLAVEGLEGDAYWEAWRLLEEMISVRPVDLVEFETARPSLHQAIQRHGVELLMRGENDRTTEV